jgi:hypothetical protein
VAAPGEEGVDAVAVGGAEGVAGGAVEQRLGPDEADEPGALGVVGVLGEGGDPAEGADGKAVGDLLEAVPGAALDDVVEEEPHGLVAGQGRERVEQGLAPAVVEPGDGRGLDEERRAVERGAFEEGVDRHRAGGVVRQGGDPGLREPVGRVGGPQEPLVALVAFEQSGGPVRAGLVEPVGAPGHEERADGALDRVAALGFEDRLDGPVPGFGHRREVGAEAEQFPAETAPGRAARAVRDRFDRDRVRVVDEVAARYRVDGLDGEVLHDGTHGELDAVLAEPGVVLAVAGVSPEAGADGVVDQERGRGAERVRFAVEIGEQGGGDPRVGLGVDRGRQQVVPALLDAGVAPPFGVVGARVERAGGAPAAPGCGGGELLRGEGEGVLVGEVHGHSFAVIRVRAARTSEAVTASMSLGWLPSPARPARVHQ